MQALASANQLFDCELVIRAQQGDKEAFRILIERYDGRISRMIGNHIRDRAGVDDVHQEALIRCWFRLKTLRDPCKFPAWYFTIARHCVYDWNRNRDFCGSLEDENLSSYSDPGSDPLERAILMERLRKAWLTIPKGKQREAVRLYFLGQSYEQIARDLDLKLSTVGVFVSSGKKKLYKAFLNSDSEEENRKENT